MQIKSAISVLVLIIISVSLSSAQKKETRNIQMESASPWTISLSVKDIKVSQEWYTSKLGFEVSRALFVTPEGVGIVRLELNGFQIEMVSLPKSASRESLYPIPSNVASIRGIYKFGFIVKDLDKTIAELKTKGIALKKDVFKDEWQGIKAVTIEDPDKNIIQLVQKVKISEQTLKTK